MTLKEFFTRDRFAASSGVELIEVEPNRAVARMTVAESHLNGVGTCQGGALFTLADLAFAAAANSGLKTTVSASAQISFVRASRLGDVLTAEARITADHHRLPVGNVVITNQDGKIIATFTSTGYRRDEQLFSAVE